MESPLREWVEEAVWAAALDQQLAAREVAGVALAETLLVAPAPRTPWPSGEVGGGCPPEHAAVASTANSTSSERSGGVPDMSAPGRGGVASRSVGRAPPATAPGPGPAAVGAVH